MFPAARGGLYRQIHCAEDLCEARLGNDTGSSIDVVWVDSMGRVPGYGWGELSSSSGSSFLMVFDSF